VDRTYRIQGTEGRGGDCRRVRSYLADLTMVIDHRCNCIVAWARNGYLGGDYVHKKAALCRI